MPDDASRSDAERTTELIEGGAELAGASIGAAIGLIGGPVGMLGGAAAGAAATHVLRHIGSELQQRWLGPRERVRVGGALAIAAECIATRLEAHEIPRDDGFFERQEDAVIWEGAASSAIQEAARHDPPVQVVFGDEMSLEVDELERLGLLGRGEPGGTPKRGGATFADAGSLAISSLSLTGPGARLYKLMNLSSIPGSDREVLVAGLERVRPA